MMFFGLGKLFYVPILLVNAMAVLSEDRFLARIGWSTQTHESQQNSFGASHDPASAKAKMVNLITSVRTVARIPLIPINLIVIIYELLLG